MLASYKLIKESNGVPEGTLVYLFEGNDHGMSESNTLEQNDLYVTVTLSPDKEPPFFSVPAKNLQYLGEMW